MFEEIIPAWCKIQNSWHKYNKNISSTASDLAWDLYLQFWLRVKTALTDLV